MELFKLIVSLPTRKLLSLGCARNASTLLGFSPQAAMDTARNPSVWASDNLEKNEKKKGWKKGEEDLSDEDLALSQQLDLYVERVQDPDPAVQKLALHSLRKEIRSITSSMICVPKQLKFLLPHYATLKAFLEMMMESDIKSCLADILSVLAFIMSIKGQRESLKYRLLCLSEDMDSWGHAYVRNLAEEVIQEIPEAEEYSMLYDTLMELAEKIAVFYMKHHVEIEAIDLLSEFGYLSPIVGYVDSTNYRRVCSYLTSFSSFADEECHLMALDMALMLYMKFGDLISALRIALFLDKIHSVMVLYASTADLLLKKQFSYILARHGSFLPYFNEMANNDEDREALRDIAENKRLSEAYLALARDLDVMEPKSPEDIYKVHLIDGQAHQGSNLHSFEYNLAATFVNAFVNAGFGQDKLLIIPSESSAGSSDSWVLKNKEHGKASAAASLGMILLWDVNSGFTQIEKHLWSSDNHVVAGALLGFGIMCCGILKSSDAASIPLTDFLDEDDTSIQIGAIIALGIALAGVKDDNVKYLLFKILTDQRSPMKVIVFAAITLGLIFVGSQDTDIAQSIVSVIINCSEAQWNHPFAHLLPVALGLLYLGTKKWPKVDKRVMENTSKSIWPYLLVTVDSLAFAGTGNVLKIQEFLRCCAQHYPSGRDPQGSAVLGIALVAMAEEVGQNMAIRSMRHLLRYGGQNIRRAVPLALGILYISNPKIDVMNTLSRLSHDTDSNVAMAAIISLGLIGAGTNNSRIADKLRRLLKDYRWLPWHLFCTRIALGLVHLGKGLLTLSPYHSDRFLLCPKALAGLVTVLYTCLDMRYVTTTEFHHILYFLVLAMQPRMLMTVNENLKPLSVPVRVGQAVDILGKAGQPKTITRFRTHLTPVLLAAGERAELATEKYVPLTQVLEGFVILRENTQCQGK